MFEEALISNEENLYILRDAFDFNSHPSRNLMLVNYIVLMGSPFQLYNVTIPWTNSKIYTIIHPAILFTFQSGLLTITYYYLEGVINTPNITLALIVENESNMTTNNAEVEHVLSTLTKRVNNAAIHVIILLHDYHNNCTSGKFVRGPSFIIINNKLYIYICKH